MRGNRFFYQKNVKKKFLVPPVSRKSALYAFSDNLGHNTYGLSCTLRKIISVPFLKVAISGGNVGRPSKSYISGKSGASGTTPAGI